MYSDIVDVFLNSIRALRFYVNSVEENIDFSLPKAMQVNGDTISALLMHIVLKAKKKGIVLRDAIQYPENMPKDVSEFLDEAISKLDKIIVEKEIDGKTIYQYKYVPKSIKREYQKFEAREQQEGILYSGTLMLLVTYFENLVAGVFKKDFLKHPKRVSLDEKSVSYKMMSEIGDIEEIKNFLIDQEISNKMYESVEEWKKFFQRSIKLKLISWNDNFDHLKEIIARRNLFVHNNGIINNIYISLVKDADTSSIGKQIGISREYIDDAINTIEYLGMALVIEAWIKEYANDEDEIKVITDMIYEEYLENEKWEMAKHFYEICMENPKISLANKMLCSINCWQCYKWLGEYEKIRADVEKVDVSAYKPMYILGILALKDEYKEFFEYYDQQTDISEDELKEWPLFRELRNSKEYQERYPEVVEEKKEIDTEEGAN